MNGHRSVRDSQPKGAGAAGARSPRVKERGVGGKPSKCDYRPEGRGVIATYNPEGRSQRSATHDPGGRARVRATHSFEGRAQRAGAFTTPKGRRSERLVRLTPAKGGRGEVRLTTPGGPPARVLTDNDTEGGMQVAVTDPRRADAGRNHRPPEGGCKAQSQPPRG